MKITEKVLLENEFYLYSENGGGPASHSITNGKLAILNDKQRLEFSYPYNQPTFTICHAILAEGRKLFLIVSDWLEDEGLYILSFSDSASSYAIVGEGLTGFFSDRWASLFVVSRGRRIPYTFRQSVKWI